MEQGQLTLKRDDSELVLAIVGPVGADLDSVVLALEERFKLFGYTPLKIRLSTLIKSIKGLKTQVVEDPPAKRFETYMTAGDEARENLRNDVLALSAVAQIFGARVDGQPRERHVYILRSLKHPEEVRTLRAVYGHGFFLLGIHAPRDTRLNYLIQDKGISKEDAVSLIDRDEAEPKKGPNNSGQRTRDTFELADAFVAMHRPDWKKQIWRVLDILFGCPIETPTRDEYAMFQAYASSFRSADLSRQVGAVIMSPRGDIVATGCNDVPSPGGGLYWSGDPHDKRDFQKTFDSNAREKNAMLERLLKALGLIESDAPKAALDELVKKHRDALKETGLLDITEFGRAVHAEMEALLSCARTGATTRDCILFSTTFPCHNCAKHIVAAGIARVVYIEPYPKSKALELHDDAIHLASDTEEHATCGGPSKVSFEPFVGIGPRCFVDLFSLSLGDGRGVERKTSDGSAIEWTRAAAGLRVPVQPTSYIEIESAVGEFMEHHLITESEE